MDGSYQSLEALPVEHLQIVFVASSSCSDDDAAAAASAPVCQQRPASKKNLPNGFTNPSSPKAHDLKAKSKKPHSKRVTGKDRGRARKAGPEKKAGGEEEVLDTPPDGFPLRRVISIEEDHLLHLLHGGPQPLLHQLSEEDAREARSDPETSAASSAAHLAIQVSPEAPQARKPHFNLSSRGQPVGKENQQVRPVQPMGISCSDLKITPHLLCDRLSSEGKRRTALRSGPSVQGRPGGQLQRGQDLPAALLLRGPFPPVHDCYRG